MRNEQEGPEQMHRSAPPTAGSSGKLRPQPARGMIGKPEMLALGAAALLLLVTLAAYFFWLAPARARLEASGRERARLRAVISSATQSAREGENTQATVAEIVASLRNFEESGLAARSESRMVVIEELNDLFRRHSLRPSGLSFTPVDPVAPTAGATTSAARARQSVFPETAISLAVEGSYPNLRRFIRGIETSRQFVVINSVELESVTDTGAGGARAALVSLRLEMSAYYRRAGDAQTTPAGME